jgi:hypothetical protein
VDHAVGADLGGASPGRWRRHGGGTARHGSDFDFFSQVHAHAVERYPHPGGRHPVDGAGTRAGGLASMLDLDGDGNPLDDMLGMAGKLMR